MDPRSGGNRGEAADALNRSELIFSAGKSGRSSVKQQPVNGVGVRISQLARIGA